MRIAREMKLDPVERVVAHGRALQMLKAYVWYAKNPVVLIAMLIGLTEIARAQWREVGVIVGVIACRVLLASMHRVRLSGDTLVVEKWLRSREFSLDSIGVVELGQMRRWYWLRREFILLDEDGYVLGENDGNPYSADELRSGFRALGKTVRGDWDRKIKPSELRHWFASSSDEAPGWPDHRPPRS